MSDKLFEVIPLSGSKRDFANDRPFHSFFISEEGKSSCVGEALCHGAWRTLVFLFSMCNLGVCGIFWIDSLPYSHLLHYRNNCSKDEGY